MDIPQKVLESLPRYPDNKVRQLLERHEIYCNVGFLPKKKEAIYNRIVLESSKRWIPFPVSPSRLYECIRIHSIGLKHAYKNHPEICVNGKFPVSVAFDLFDSIKKKLPFKLTKGVYKSVFRFGYTLRTSGEVELTFKKMDNIEIAEKMPECVEYYKYYFDCESFEVLYCELPKEFLKKYNVKSLDKKLMKEKKLEKEKSKQCWNPECVNKEKEFDVELKSCSRCGKAKYCSKECQVKHWKIHKKKCKK